MAAELRPYQASAVAAVEASWARGVRSVLGQMATGGGKTVTAATVVTRRAAGTRRRWLWLAHRQELIDQPYATFQRFFPEIAACVGRVAGGRGEVDEQVVIATVQSLQGKRLERLLATGAFDGVVTDECHHALSPSYMAVYERLRAANPDLLHLGVTATPERGDGDGLVRVYDEVAFAVGIKDLVEQGYLVRPVGRAVYLEDVSLAGVKMRAGDYAADDLATVMEVDNALELIAHEVVASLADGRRPIVFLPSVRGAHKVAEICRARGFRVEAADGTTPAEERAGVLERVRSGETQGLCNAFLYTEGLDLPMIDCVVVARPTTRGGAYHQMAGRGLRLWAGKTDCRIVDLVPMEGRSLVSSADLLGKPITLRRLEERAIDKGVATASGLGGAAATGIDGTVDQMTSRPLELLAHQPFRWLLRDGMAALDVGLDVGGSGRTLVITKPGRTGERLLLVLLRNARTKESAIKLVRTGPFEALMAEANRRAEESGTPTLIRGGAWGRKKISPQQLRLCRWLASEVHRDELETYDSDRAARLITWGYARRQISEHNQKSAA